MIDYTFQVLGQSVVSLAIISFLLGGLAGGAIVYRLVK